MLSRPYIIGVGLLVLLQSAFIAALLVQRTRRVRVERALRESEERFRLMADTAPVLVWRADTANLCDFVNRPWLEFTGRTMEQELGNGWAESVWPDDLDRCLRTCVSAFDARQPFRMEFRLRRADGVYRWVLDTGVPRYGPDGSFAGYIGSCLDITERKASEDALRDSQQRYTLATAAGAVGVWDWNFETNEIYVDPTLKSILGFDDAEITIRADDWGSRVHPEDVPMVTARAQACIDGRIDEYEVEHRMIHKDGSVRWFLSRGSLLRRADGTPHRMVGTKVDITERKRAEEAIREQEAVLRVSDQEIQNLVGRLIAAQEVERSRIARDLHDDTSQQLAGLAIALSGLKRQVGALQGVERSAGGRVIASAAYDRAGGERPAPLPRPASQRAGARRTGCRPDRLLHRSPGSAARHGDVQFGGGLRRPIGRGGRALPVSDRAGSAPQRRRARGRPPRRRPAAAHRRQRRAHDRRRRQGIRYRQDAREAAKAWGWSASASGSGWREEPSVSRPN